MRPLARRAKPSSRSIAAVRSAEQDERQARLLRGYGPGYEQGCGWRTAGPDGLRSQDALELETIIWLPEGHLTQLLDPSADRWRDA